MIDRRSLLSGTAVTLLSLAVDGAHAEVARGAPEKPELFFGPEVAFSFEALTGWARDLSTRPYQTASPSDPALIERIDFDAYQDIRFKPEWAIWNNGEETYPVQLFHVGKYFKQPVRIFVVSKTGTAREVRYGRHLFDYGPKSAFAEGLPENTGFAGFRVMSPNNQPDWLAFLGASYFRTPGETKQYGMSCRGLAIDVAMPTPEEFPRFTHFWLEPLPGKPGLVINALLDSPRITGAYRIETIHESGTLMTVTAHLFPRADIARPGIAPLTSMFWYAKGPHKQPSDWRPEIHDSDGLALWSGKGERIWRPLNNPPGVQTSTFFDTSPKGFGLMQRERRFSQYEDDGAFYDRRPSVWVEPLGDWGAGAVQLVEIPTNDEVQDNIAAYWTPKEPFKAGEHYEVGYKLHWRLDEPYVPSLARVIETHIGEGGIPGQQPRPKGTLKYVVDFKGGALEKLHERGDVEIVVSAPSGLIERAVAYPVVDSDKWRAMFDFTAASASPVDLRLYLKRGSEAISETWLFQHVPVASPA